MDRKHKAINLTAFITAITTAAGSIGYGQLTAGDRDDIKTQMAVEWAGYHVWKKETDKKMEELRIDNRRLVEAVIKLQATVEHRGGRRSARVSRDLDELDKLLEAIGRERRQSKGRKAPTLEQHQIDAYKAKMFAEDDDDD